MSRKASDYPDNWGDLVQVIQFAESLGPGNIVFKLSGNPNYGICKAKEVSADVERTGKLVMTPGILLGYDEKRFVIYRTKGTPRC